MMYCRILLCAALILLPLGCGGDAPVQPAPADPIRPTNPNLPPNPSAPANPAYRSNPANPSNAAPRTPAATPRTAITRSDMPVPPADARYTLVCFTFTGPAHYKEAAKARQNLMQGQFKNWYIIQSAKESTLYHGFYKAISEQDATDAGLTPAQKRELIQEADRAQADKKAIDALTNERGDKPFQKSFFVNLDSNDPIAPPDWNLANLRQSKGDKKHYWSLQIAAFKDNPLRKQAAVDAVREARAQGVPAYFYHGDTVSSVCVGTWPYHALKEQQTAGGQSADSKSVIVISERPLSPALIDQLKRHGKIVVLTPRVEILDQTLIDMIKRFPRHAVNYNETRRKTPNAQGGWDDVYDPSFLVVIPPATQGKGMEADPISPSEDPLDRLQLHPTDTPGGGRLRTFGEK